MKWILTWLDRRRPRTVTGWIITGLLVAVVLGVVHCALRIHQINRFQYAIERKFEITFVGDNQLDFTRDSLLERFIYDICGRMSSAPMSAPGYWHRRPTRVYSDPIITCKYWRITGIDVYESADFTPELGQVLRSFKDLRSFELHSGEYRTVNPAGADSVIAGICDLPHLERLQLGGKFFDAKYLASLEQIRTLEVLELEQVAINDDAIPALSRFKHLRSLRIFGGQISKEGVERLMAALPDTAIYCEDDNLAYLGGRGSREDLKWLSGWPPDP
jgi:hypothetical protein